MAERIFIKLTEAEIAERSRALAQKVGEWESLRNEAKQTAKDFKKEVDDLAEEIQELATAIRSGQEERDAQMELIGEGLIVVKGVK